MKTIFAILMLITAVIVTIVFPIHYMEKGWTHKEQNLYDSGYAVGIVCGLIIAIAIKILM